MKKNDDPKSAIDYSQGQKDAAYSVLGEIANLLADYSDNLRIIGGWVPTLLYPDKEHIGSIDVDILLNQQKIQKARGYENIRRILTKNGYTKHPDKYFAFVKRVIIDDVEYAVDVDFLSGKYGGDSGNVSKHIGGIKALPATAGNFAFEFQPQKIKIEYRRPDGAKDFGNISVISVVPYMVMKAAALGRGKPKDSYDIYCTITGYPGGVIALAEEFLPYANRTLIREMCEKLSEKFASPDHAGPTDIVTFLGISETDEIAQIKQDAYQRINYLLNSISSMSNVN